MQQQPERRYNDGTEPVVHRFPQNSNSGRGWEPQGSYAPQPYQPYHQQFVPQDDPAPLTKKEQRKLRRAEKQEERMEKERRAEKRRLRFSLTWNLLAVIGLITVLVQGARYIVIPLLVYLRTLSGGAL